MNTIRHKRLIASFYGLALLISSSLLPLNVSAQNLNVPAFTSVTLYPGDYYDTAIVRSNGVLVLNGGEIGTLSNGILQIEQGGKFYMNEGGIYTFENDGEVGFYGGRQSTDSSVNRGYVKLAGGDPGIQLIHNKGTVDIYYLATNRLSWEINTEVTNNAPAIRIFSLTNSLATGTYTYATLPNWASTPFGISNSMYSLQWSPVSNRQLQTEITIASNWLGSVTVSQYVPLSSAITSSIRRTAFNEVSWNSVSGRTYQVQDALNLIAGDWENMSTPISSTGTVSLINDANPFLQERFYRILLRH